MKLFALPLLVRASLALSNHHKHVHQIRDSRRQPGPRGEVDSYVDDVEQEDAASYSNRRAVLIRDRQIQKKLHASKETTSTRKLDSVRDCWCLVQLYVNVLSLPLPRH